MYVAAILLKIATFSPLIGSIVAGCGALLGDRVTKFITIGMMAVSTVAASGCLFFLYHHNWVEMDILLFTWVDAGSFHTKWSLKLDPLSVSMVCIVSSISLLVHLYSIGYMGKEGRPVYRFFAYLSLFTYAMLMLVTSDNLIQLFFGWEGVGLCSYFLIGYWYDRPQANQAAIKAFIVNRAADLFFLIGICLLFALSKSVDYNLIFNFINHHKIPNQSFFTSVPIYETISVLLFVGAMGKSAQLFFHTWLPDAMEGPTPASALIHAATMVTAGVFLLVRMSPLIEVTWFAKDLILFIGSSTAFFSATIGLVQPDLKKTIAYSTCSQLGYMFMAIGAGAYQASMFHLTTHAFFKSLLFLSAGSIIHAMRDEQNMLRMGGLWKKLPFTYGCTWVGCLALGGFYPFAGYWSKDVILEKVWDLHTGWGQYAWILGCITTFLTASYSWRMLFLVFHGQQKSNKSFFHTAHESGLSMTLPMLILALGAVFSGVILSPYYTHYSVWSGVIGQTIYASTVGTMGHLPLYVTVLPTIFAGAGGITALICYVIWPSIPALLARKYNNIYLFLLNKWYFDEFYRKVFIRPYFVIAKLLRRQADEKIIGEVPPEIAKLTHSGATLLANTQTGSIAIYAFTMVIGAVVLLSMYIAIY